MDIPTSPCPQVPCDCGQVARQQLKRRSPAGLEDSSPMLGRDSTLQMSDWPCRGANLLPGLLALEAPDLQGPLSPATVSLARGEATVEDQPEFIGQPSLLTTPPLPLHLFRCGRGAVGPGGLPPPLRWGGVVCCIGGGVQGREHLLCDERGICLAGCL